MIGNLNSIFKQKIKLGVVVSTVWNDALTWNDSSNWTE
jgi:hypothetical protein